MLANLVVWVAILLGILIIERRDRATYYTRDRRIRYRRLSTEQALARLRKTRR